MNYLDLSSSNWHVIFLIIANVSTVLVTLYTVSVVKNNDIKTDKIAINVNGNLSMLLDKLIIANAEIARLKNKYNE